MTIWGILSLLFKAFGLAQWADALWTKHEVAVQAKRANNAQTEISRDSDADVADKLRDKYTRD